MRGVGLNSRRSGATPLVGVQIVYSFDVGGSETLALRLARALDSPAGRWGLVAARSAEGPISEEAARAGLQTTYLDLERVGRVARLPRLVPLAQWLRQRNVQVAHVHHLVSLRDTYLALKLGGVRRIVLTEHTAEPFREVRHLPIAWRLYDRLADAVTVVSGEIAEEIRHRVPGARIPLVIPNGVDTEYFVPTAGDREDESRPCAVGWLGRLHPHKDVCTGIRAFAAARTRSRDPGSLRMIIGGAGPEEAAALNLVNELGLSAVVAFRGRVGDARAFLHECDVLLISSVTEGLPLVLLEAMSCGLPVVATDVGGIKEALGEGGRISPAGDVEAMGCQLIELLESRGLTLELGRRGRQRAVERYSMADMVSRYRQVLLAESGANAVAVGTGGRERR